MGEFRELLGSRGGVAGGRAVNVGALPSVVPPTAEAAGVGTDPGTGGGGFSRSDIDAIQKFIQAQVAGDTLSPTDLTAPSSFFTREPGKFSLADLDVILGPKAFEQFFPFNFAGGVPQDFIDAYISGTGKFSPWGEPMAPQDFQSAFPDPNAVLARAPLLQGLAATPGYGKGQGGEVERQNVPSPALGGAGG